MSLDDLRWSDIRVSFANEPRDCTALAEAFVAIVLHTWPIEVVSYRTPYWAVREKKGQRVAFARVN